MNQSLIKILLLCFWPVAFLSCTKNLEIDIEEMEVKPVINCMFEPEKPMVVNISLSKSPTDSINYIVTNAEVFVYNDVNEKSELPHLGKGKYSLQTFKPRAGIIYHLQVEIPGYEIVFASSSIPNGNTKVVSIESKSGYNNAPVHGTGDTPQIPVENIKLSVFDDKAIDDFLGISVIQKQVNYFYKPDGELEITEVPDKYILSWYFGSTDIKVISEGIPDDIEKSIQLFRDVAFGGQNEEVTFFVKKEIKSAYWIRFFKFSPEAFSYTKSWILHDYTKDYDFWEIYEPLPLYSNITNGHGIFAGYNSQLYNVFPDSVITINP